MADQQEVFDKVRNVLMDALSLDEDEVESDARLVSDLGAESIDFLDIVFRLEKAFGIKIEQSELFPDNVLNDARYVNDGKVTDEGLEVLRARLPHADLTEFEKDRSVEAVGDLFTVDTVVRFVMSKLESQTA